MEPTLVVIGLSYRTASLAVRERFFMNDPQRDDAVHYLIQREGIDEIVVFSTCNRTEFYVWSQDPSEASNSILRFLTRSYDLKLSEWSNFYRLVDDAALIHILRVASGLDTNVFGDPDVLGVLRIEWQLAKRTGTTGQVLDSVMGHAFEVAQRVRREASAAVNIMPLSFAAVEQCRELFPDLKSRSVLVLGSGHLAEIVVPALKQGGVTRIGIASMSPESDVRLANQTSSVALPYENCAQEVFNADIVICATSSKSPIITAAGLDPLMRSRSERPLIILDLGVPRNVESAVRGVPQVFLFDTDDLSESVHHRLPSRPLSAEAESIVRQEAACFLQRLRSNGALPAIAALRQHLEQLCHEELDYVAERYGPLTEDQTSAMRAFATHITQRISASLARHVTQANEQSQPNALAESIEQLLLCESKSREN